MVQPPAADLPALERYSDSVRETNSLRSITFRGNQSPRNRSPWLRPEISLLEAERVAVHSRRVQCFSSILPARKYSIALLAARTEPALVGCCGIPVETSTVRRVGEI